MNILIVGKETCIDCVRSKDACSNVGLNYISVNIDTMASELIVSDLIKAGVKLPYIFIDSKYIGGYQKFCTFLNNYELQNNLNLDDF